MWGFMVTRDGIGERRLLPALTLVLLLFAIAAILYARVQNIWVDETTQLSGSTLTPGPLLAWLAGDLQLPFGVPPDRMPPVSYFIDMIGWRIWGDNLLAFRLLHAAITGLGIAVLMAAVARRFSLAAALATGLILALSPKLIETAVEIRAYPIFFTLSCLQLAMVLRGDVAARTGRMALFILLGLLSAYTHFFGVIATSAYLVAIFIDVRDVRAAVRVVIGYALLLLLWTGLAPFIFGAVSNSPANQVAATDLDAIATFILQLLSNAAIMVDPFNALLYFGGVALLVLLGAIGLLAIVRTKGLAEARHDPAVGIALALVAGIGVVLGAAFVIKGFSTLAPRYNVWLMPPVALMIGLAAAGAITPNGKAARGLRLGALALLLIGAVWAQIAFLKRAGWFIHGPSTTLEQMIAEADAPVAIVHAGQGWAWGYFPLYWKHKDALPQWLLTPDGRAAIRIGRGGDPGGTPQPLSILKGYRTLLVSQVQLMTYEDLRLIRADPSRMATRELAPGLGSAGWRSGAPVYRPGNYAFTGQLYHKPRTPGQAAPIAPTQ
jgi:4-amino-4-deoxy-L-arabinose transferase-like glycosyltransferase